MMVALVQLVPPKVIGVVVDEIVNKEIRLTKNYCVGCTLDWCWSLPNIFFAIFGGCIFGGVPLVWKKSYGLNYFIISQKMDSIFYQKYRTGDLMAHATNDLNAIQKCGWSWGF
ncbi:hypothetical protein JG559_13065 [Enterococcus faecalis]|uniref:Uncharacterized protein n=1 Tax=Enterococcus faecalis TaxID=1351 RepID=A0A974NZ14_ENTFL|nr:hypothetical protein JG559_13065 [Enterococcus faecalis]